MENKTVRSIGIRNGHRCAVTSSERSHNGRNTILTVLAILSISTIHAIGDGEGAGGAIGKSDSIGVNISHFASFGDGGDAVTISAVITGFTLRSLRSGSSLAQEEGLRSAASLGNRNHITRIGWNNSKGRNIACLAGIQGIRHAQQLLNSSNVVVESTRRVNLRFQIIRSIGPIDVGENS